MRGHGVSQRSSVGDGTITLTDAYAVCNAGERRVRVFMLPVLLLFSSAGVAAPAQDSGPARYEIEISKSRNELLIRDGTDVVKRFYAAFGSGGKGAKRRRGDDMTPVGAYRIVEFKSDSRFHFFMLLNYPNLVDGWHGYRENTIDASQFKAIAAAWRVGATPPQDTPLGGYIGIHGIGEVTPKKLDIHDSQNWTQGCIALRNEEIIELRDYVTRGTRVVIRE